jgi:hypothetical protein
MLVALAISLKGSLGIGATVIAFALFYVILGYSKRDKGNPELAQWLQQYASERRYDLWVRTPGRFSFLHPADALGTKLKLSGIQNGASFEVMFSVFDRSDQGDYQKSTWFNCVPTWLPDNSGLGITVGPQRKSWLYSNPEPALVRYGIHVYVSPPELVSAFEGPLADKLLEDFARTSSVSEIMGARQSKYVKYGQSETTLSASVNGWCDDARVLDATIDILTRLCRLH